MSANIGPKLGITVNGLQIYLDAGLTTSYPTFGTTWKSLYNTDTISGSLVNNPTFQNVSGGGITFNGTNYCPIQYTANPPYFTLEVVVKLNSLADGYPVVGKYAGGQDWWVALSGGSWIFSTNGIGLGSGIAGNTTQNVLVTCGLTQTGKIICINGIQKNITSYSPCSPGGRIFLATFGESLLYSAQCTIRVFKYYDRGLSSEEIYNNYLGLKTRFNL